ncbi:hypothetical protein [Maridesulfovibrio sp.]|uniref:hypothetical protein n=1 Tax=Maridesulfovibrio sp. TaxID=2795000 RepID=UPI0029F56BC0|nr:hypothetical protein [Maridesulfovibrio sp.]
MKTENQADKKFIHKNGTTYFSKQTERQILFVLTSAMLLWGLVEGIRSYLN